VIYSDNGTTFVGANTELQKLLKMINDEKCRKVVSNMLLNEGTEWRFIPPKAPHFGGIWEAGIKSVKQHLRRVVGDTVLTFEELYTVLTQIEACLNSRPLCPLSSDPNDLSALTPSHFLIGEPLTAIPDPNLLDCKSNRLQRWQLVRQISQSFWKRWHTEYLTQLQEKPKWKTPRPNLKINDLVLVKEDNLPPLKWNIGRVVDAFPGEDKCVRVVTVKTKDGLFKRPIVKLCKLPTDER